jgi:polyisoprenoid-binding protein YceI
MVQAPESTQMPVARTIDGASVPNAGVYDIDPVHTFVTFGTRHLRIGQVRGGFTSFSGTITVDEDPSRTIVDLSVETASVDTGQKVRDADLRSPRFFNTERFERLVRTDTVRKQPPTDGSSPVSTPWALTPCAARLPDAPSS